MARALQALLLLLGASSRAAQLALSDAEYYRMPALFALEPLAACRAAGGLYCLGSFELQPAGAPELFASMQRFSENWVENFNHTRLHRGVCVTRSCRAPGARASGVPAAGAPASPQAWFASCVNESTTAEYGLSARLYHLDYCQRGEDADGGDAGGDAGGVQAPLSANERAFTAAAAALLALAAISTTLDLVMSEHAKRAHPWALSWSIRGSWATLSAPAGGAGGAAGVLAPLDGLRVVCMLCVIVEHVCWVATHAYLADTRVYEKMRWSVMGMLLANSTLVVQVFFLMSSFLLAHKLLATPPRASRRAAFCDVMLNRVIRISPSYFFVLWYAGSVWARAGGGPLAPTLLGAEAAVCRHKWWTHLLYLNNLIYPDEKCLIQTWYLAADMQLYAVSLALTLALGAGGAGGGGAVGGGAVGGGAGVAGRCWRAVRLLGALLAACTAAVFALAYWLRLVPTFVIHNPEAVRATYAGDSSFNLVYQSPLGNLPGALAGLMLAHAHRALLADAAARPADRRWFRWLALCGAPLATLWAALCPRLLALGGADGGATGGAARGVAAALAALERPVFVSLVSIALLGAMHGVDMPWRAWLGWRGWALAARLSFGALLLHLQLNKLLVAARPLPSHLDASAAMFEWCGVAVLSYLAAVPLALLVEVPAQRLYRALSAPAPPPAAPEKSQAGS